MSKIGDAVIQAEEEKLEGWRGKWQEETRKMHELAERWGGIYPQIEGVVGEVRYIKGKENEHI